MKIMATLSKPPMLAAKGAADKPASFERHCENADCNVNKLVNMVMRRKTPQFVTQPSVVDKPLLVNGFTTIFQVDGSAAKLNDIRPKNNIGKKTIYRIMPNTHVHIVNYVVVDEGGDSMRKINSGDPAIMRQLLESQRLSADQMLKKLMTEPGKSLKVTTAQTSGTMTKVIMQRNPETVTATEPENSTPSANINEVLAKINKSTVVKLPMRQFTLKKHDTNTVATTTTAAAAATTTISAAPAITTNTKLLNARLSSQIQIKSFVPANGENKTRPEFLPVPATTVNNMAKLKRFSGPVIKTVPLSQLQQPKNVPTTSTKPTNLAAAGKVVRITLPLEMQTIANNLVTTTAGVATTASSFSSSAINAPDKDPKVDSEKSMFAKMQQEIEELRRTVSFLAAAQKKTIEKSDSELSSEPLDYGPAKRPREN